MSRFAFALFLLGLLAQSARAVEIGLSPSETFNTSTPTVTNWSTGWGTTSLGGAVTGWNYVGSIGDVTTPGSYASATYLGSGWVITAGHVGAGTFTLNGVAYTVSSVGASINTGSSGTADITLFQINAPDGGTLPDLPALTLATTAPAINSSVVMLGFGNSGTGTESWGKNKVSANAASLGQDVSVNGFVSEDFVTAYGSAGNQANLIVGDSGGGDFIWDSTHSVWTLAGINEAIDGSNNSYLVQLSSYADQINAITGISGVPEPGTWALLGLGLILVGVAAKSRRTASSGHR